MITARELRLLNIIAELQAHVDRLGAVGGDEVSHGVVRAFAAGKLSASRLHKAGSAEAILSHCLRQLGLTARYRQGKLTRKQARTLLEAIRQYGRAWLRHEAEAFMAGQKQARGIRWDDTGNGFLHATDTGFIANAGRFFKRVKQFVRETIVAGVMSLLGPAPLTGEELNAAELEAQKQEQFFERLEQEVISPNPTMTPAQFVARVERYADSSWQSSQRINRSAAIGQGIAKRERRVLGNPKTSHCEDCPPLAEMGWQPVGTLPDIGDTECGPLCLCHFEYEDAAGKTFFQGKKGIIPSPTPPVQIEPEDDGIYPVAEPPGGLGYDVPIAGPPKR